MKIVENINNNSIIICPNSVKNKILNELDKLLNIKFITLEELKKSYYFDYDNESVLFIMDNYNFDSDFSKNLLDSLYLVNENNKGKLNLLYDIKNKLDDNNLLIYDDLFKSFLNNKDIYCIGYSNIDKCSMNILKSINCNILYNKNNCIKRTVYKFKTLENEVEFVFTKISELINNGVDLNKIKISILEDKYIYTIKRYSNLFNIPVFIENNSIYSTNVVKEFLNKLTETKSFVQSLNYIYDLFDMTNENNNSIYNKIFSICNTYNDLDYSFDNIYKLIVNDIKNTSVSSKRLDKQIELINIENNIFDDEYVFLMGFNLSLIPNTYNDEEYISDSLIISSDLNIDTSFEKNIKSKNSVIYSLNNIDNLFITCKEKSIDQDYLISNLVNELNYDVIDYDFNYLNSYSDKLLNIKLASYLDDFIKFGIINDNLKILNSNLKIDYLSYSNKFTGINNNLILKKYKDGLTLSYTHIDDYFHCAFKYYLSHVLYLDKFEESFSTIIGNLFHNLLSICYNVDFDYELEFNKYVQEQELDNMQKFFINKLKNELEYVINNVKKLQMDTGLNKLLLEHKITIDKSSLVPVIFKGFVDKIMYKEKDNTLVSIVDYKTGNTSIDLYNVIYGLSLQLPVYLYMVKKSNMFSNVRFTGFYLQHILSNEVNFDVNKTYLEQKESGYKLDGYSNSDVSILEVFIPDYENSKYVKSMKTTSKGFGPYTKVLSDEEIDSLINVVDLKINEARDNILDGNFDINPKSINEDKVGCLYCKYKDICFRTNDDYIKLKENKSLSFLGGDNNA